MAGRSSNPTAHAAYDLPESKERYAARCTACGNHVRQYIRSGYPFPAPDNHLWIKKASARTDIRQDNWDITVTKWMIFYLLGLEATTDDSLTVEELIRMTMRTGEMALAVMKKT